MAPQLNISIFYDNFFLFEPFIISGAMYPGVPKFIYDSYSNSVILHEIPKSINFKFENYPNTLNSILSGLMSRWTKPLSCK